MVIVDACHLTLYVTVELSVIFHAREYIYVMHTAYNNSRGCTLTWVCLWAEGGGAGGVKEVGVFFPLCI